eukprot:3166373-Amphidinium_carterae.1
MSHEALTGTLRSLQHDDDDDDDDDVQAPNIKPPTQTNGENQTPEINNNTCFPRPSAFQPPCGDALHDWQSCRCP